MDKIIRKRQFLRALMAQPFFIWHSLTDQEFETDQVDWDIDEDDFFHDEETEVSTKNIIFQTLGTLERVLKDRFRQTLINHYPKDKVIYITEKKVEARVAETQAALKSGKLIIGPVFQYQNAIATPFAFDAATKTIIDLKYSAKVSRLDMIKGFYDYAIASQVMEDLNYQLWLQDGKPHARGEIVYVPTNFASFNQTAEYPEKVKPMAQVDFTQSFQQGYMLVVSKTQKEKKLDFPDLDSVLRMINSADQDSHINEKLLYKDLTGDWGANPEFKELLKEINSPFADYSGNVVSKKDIAAFYSGTIENNFHAVLSKTLVGEFLLRKNKTRLLSGVPEEYSIISQAKKVVWYDFEGFSLPYPPIDNTTSYQQIAFQVSVIVTVDNQETSVTNLVLDPRKLSGLDFVQIINAVYQDGADAYVVYNRTYENTRLSDMLLVIQPHVSSSVFTDLENKVMEITNKTVDLYEVFRISNSKIKTPPVVLHDQKGRASIKNVEKHISANLITLPRPIEPYKELPIKNGGEAMEKAMKRALNLIGDQEWLVITEQLKKYCENDVRAMIMVYDFIHYLLEASHAK